MDGLFVFIGGAVVGFLVHEILNILTKPAAKDGGDEEVPYHYNPFLGHYYHDHDSPPPSKKPRWRKKKIPKYLRVVK